MTPRRGNCFSYGQETLQFSAKGAEGEISEVLMKDRPNGHLLLQAKWLLEMWPRGPVNLGQWALEEYRSKCLYKNMGQGTLEFSGHKGPF